MRNVVLLHTLNVIPSRPVLVYPIQPKKSNSQRTRASTDRRAAVPGGRGRSRVRGALGRAPERRPRQRGLRRPAGLRRAGQPRVRRGEHGDFRPGARRLRANATGARAQSDAARCQVGSMIR